MDKFKFMVKSTMSSLKILEKENFSKWNIFVDNSPQGSIFSKTWYLDALEVDYKILVIEEKESIKAGVVLAKNEINTYSNPMLDKYLGVLFENGSGNRQKIVSKEYKYMNLLVDELKKIKSFDYYFHPSFINWIPFSWGGFTQQTRYTYRLDLSNSIEDIKRNFHTNTKRNIKNAKKHNIEIRENIKFNDFYNIINKTFIRQGSKAPFKKEKIKRYIENLEKRGNFLSFGAYINNRLISVSGVTFDNKTAYLLFNGIDIDNQIRGANTFLVYKTVEYFKDRCEIYDFEGSMLFGVEEFYRKFGGELTPYMRIWNDNFFNYAKTKAKKIYKKIRYGK